MRKGIAVFLFSIFVFQISYSQDYFSKVVEVEYGRSVNPTAFVEREDDYVVMAKLSSCGGCEVVVFLDKDSLSIIDTLVLDGVGGTGQKYWEIYEDYFFIDFDINGVGVHKFSNDGDLLASFYAPENWPTNEANSLWAANDSTLVLAVLEDYSTGPDSTNLVWLNHDLQKIYETRTGIGTEPNLDEDTNLFYEIDDDTYIVGQTISFPFDNEPLVVRKMSKSSGELWRTEINGINDGTASLNKLIYDPFSDGYFGMMNAFYFNPFPLLPWPGYQYPLKVFKISPNGELLWEFEFFHKAGRITQDIKVAENGDILGACREVVVIPEHSENGIFHDHGFIFRMSPEGDSLWARNIVDTNYVFPETSFTLQSINKVIEQSNGDLLYMGSTRTLDTLEDGNEIYNSDLWFVRTDSEGCVTPDCGDFSITSVEDLPASLRAHYLPRLQVYPNPAPKQFTIDWPPDTPEEDQLARGILHLVDMNGQTIARQSGIRLPHTWRETDLPPGQYILEWRGDNGARAKGKVIIK
ncbi:MAG: T9SS type A sorting domain-containing protein [Bacteroidota bacterium]